MPMNFQQEGWQISPIAPFITNSEQILKNMMSQSQSTPHIIYLLQVKIQKHTKNQLKDWQIHMLGQFG